MNGEANATINRRDWLGPAVTVAFLLLATWLYFGYQDYAGSQFTLLGRVLALSGELRGDWYMSFPPAHWAVEHTLAEIPSSIRPEALLAMWIATYAILWASFIAICDSLRAPWYVAAAAGLALIPTDGNGFGSSDLFLTYFYPDVPSFALSLGSLALILRKRHASAGTALGLAILIHPGAGALYAVALAPVVLRGLGLLGGLSHFDRTAALRFIVPCAVLAVPALVQVLQATGGGSLTPRQTYDFIALVRAPHHFLYRAFPPNEYLQTGLWLVGLIASCAFLWRVRAARAIGLLVAAIAAICTIGGVASQLGSPLFLVTAQTARLSTFVEVLGVAAIAAALDRLVGRALAVVALAGTFLLSPAITDRLEVKATDWITVGAVEASLLLIILAGSYWWTRRVRTAATQLSGRAATGAAGLIAVAFAGSALSLVLEHDSRAILSSDSKEQHALRDVADAAKRNTTSTQLVLASPAIDGIRVLAERPIVVDFYSVLYGEGDAEWQRRLLALTQDPAVLDPDSVGTDAGARIDLIDQDYQRVVSRSREPICRYGAKVVIAHPLEHPPPWLHPIYGNSEFELYDVRDGACRVSDPPRRA